MIVGGGIRVENYLITPTHNGQHGCDLYALRGDKAMKIDLDSEMLLAADVSAFFMPVSSWSNLGVKCAKLGPLAKVANVTATSSCDHKYSVGHLRPMTDVMGRIAYDASTMPGFSGSAYMNGNVCMGMHCHGGARGGGYEMLYLWVRLKAQLDQKMEESSDFILAQASEQAYTIEELGGNKAVIRMDSGNYHLASDEIIHRLRRIQSDQETDWAELAEEDNYRSELDRRGYEPEALLQPQEVFSGESRRPAARATPGPKIPAAPKASSSSTVNVQRPLTRRQQLMRGFACISTRQLESFLRSNHIGTRLKPTTDQRTPVQKPSGTASPASSGTQPSAGN